MTRCIGPFLSDDLEDTEFNTSLGKDVMHSIRPRSAKEAAAISRLEITERRIVDAHKDKIRRFPQTDSFPTRLYLSDEDALGVTVKCLGRVRRPASECST